ncbi:MAG TPA: hypothetical protein VGL61_27645 [Kofleriaceae bacterium]
MTAVCAHVPADYVERFTGRGLASELICAACAASNAPATIDANDELVARVRDHTRLRFDGAPAIVELPSSLSFERAELAIECPDLADLQPVGGDDRSRWLGVTRDGAVLELDLDRRETRELARVSIGVPLELHVSADARYVAVVENHGLRGAIVELATGREITQLVREDYHARHGRFPFAFVARGERQLAIFGPQWNRLAAFDVATNEALTARPQVEAGDRHALDYFHSGLHVSPSGVWIADNGWVWHPVGVIATWSLERWLIDNVWESEDGRSRRELELRDTWDIPVCWLDDTRLAVWGHGDASMDAVDIYDAHTGKLESWFAGPEYAELVFDRVLFSLGESTAVWDVARGACLLRMPLAPLGLGRYHAGAKCFATLPRDGRITISRLCGLDADKSWAIEHVRAVAASIDDPVGQLGVLGDALEDAGCTDDAMLAHCRAPGPHGARCWVLDRLRGG